MQGDAALLTERGIAMDVQVGEHEMVRHLGEQGLPEVAGAERENLPEPAQVGAELQILQPPVMRAGRDGQRRGRVRRLEDGQVRRIGGPDAHAGERQQRVGGRRPDGDVGRGRALVGQAEVAGEGRARCEQQAIAGLRAVDGGLQVGAGGDVDVRGARGRRGQQGRRTQDHTETHASPATHAVPTLWREGALRRKCVRSLSRQRWRASPVPDGHRGDRGNGPEVT